MIRRIDAQAAASKGNPQDAAVRAGVAVDVCLDPGVAGGEDCGRAQRKSRIRIDIGDVRERTRNEADEGEKGMKRE